MMPIDSSASRASGHDALAGVMTIHDRRLIRHATAEPTTIVRCSTHCAWKHHAAIGHGAMPHGGLSLQRMVGDAVHVLNV
jgi:hypothetical protein